MIRTDDIIIARSKRVNKKLYFVTLSRTKTTFLAKVQVHGSHGLPVMMTQIMACIIRTHNQPFYMK